MRFFLLITACASGLILSAVAQSTTQGAASGATIIGCLAGPGTDDHYTLTSMQHRMGVDVIGSDDLKKGAGAKVRLTGSWEALRGSDAKKGDAGRRFRATDVAVLE